VGLFEAAFVGCKLTGSSFQDVPFDGLRADGGDWSYAGLAAARLRGAAPNRLRLHHGVLRDVSFRGTDLTRADLTGARLKGAISVRPRSSGSPWRTSSGSGGLSV
jgi:fluoroquinolone resistance protein